MSKDQSETNIKMYESETRDLMRVMLEQNRLRELQMEQIINKLMEPKTQHGETSVSMMLPNLNQTLSVFDGNSGSPETAQQWLNALTTVAHLNNWPDTYTLEAGRANLKGAANQWYVSHMDKFKTLDQFTKQFKAMFISAESVTETWRKLNDRIEPRNETVYTYFHDKIALCRRLKLTETETKKMICVGLRSADMSNGLMSSGHISEVDMLAYIRMNTNEVEVERNEHFRTLLPRDRRGHIAESEGRLKTNEATSKINVISTPKISTGPRCCNCLFTGHIARDCTKPRKPLKCLKCQNVGHTVKYCKSDVSLVNFINVPSGSTDILCIKPICINGYKEWVNGFIDTGSAFTILKYFIVKRFGLTIQPKAVNMWVYGKEQPVVSIGKVQITLGIDEVQETVNCTVVDDNVQNYDVIVGRSFVDRENVTFIKTKDQLFFAYGMKFPYENSDIPCVKGKRYPVTITNSLEELPPKSTKIVNVTTQGNTMEVLMVIDGDVAVTLHKNKCVGTVSDYHDPVQVISNNVNQITSNMVNMNPEFSEVQTNQLISCLIIMERVLLLVLESWGVPKWSKWILSTMEFL